MNRQQPNHLVIAAARSNVAFRRVILTGDLLQLVLMTIAPGDETGEQVHLDTDQAVLFVEGRGEAHMDGQVLPIRADDLVLVRAGARHNLVNTGRLPLRLVAISAPPHHPPGTVHRTRAEAQAAERAG